MTEYSDPRPHITPPWNPAQVEALNLFQTGPWHEFTCPEKSSHLDGSYVLVATTWGWICPSCTYKQAWAHAYMADKAHIERAMIEMKKLFNRD